MYRGQSRRQALTATQRELFIAARAEVRKGCQVKAPMGHHGAREPANPREEIAACAVEPAWAGSRLKLPFARTAVSGRRSVTADRLLSIGLRIPRSSSPRRWSISVVRGRFFGNRGLRIHAWTAGPDGGRPIADSARFTTDPSVAAGSRTEFDELMARLRADGWEPTGEHGAHWYSVRLRRPMPFPWKGSGRQVETPR